MEFDINALLTPEIVAWLLLAVQVIGTASAVAAVLEKVVVPLEAVALKTVNTHDDKAVRVLANVVSLCAGLVNAFRPLVDFVALNNVGKRK